MIWAVELAFAWVTDSSRIWGFGVLIRMHDVSFLLSGGYLIVSWHQELLKRRLRCVGGGARL